MAQDSTMPGTTSGMPTVCVPRLAGRAAIVTGAAGGLGSAIGRRFAREGARVMLADLAPPEALQRELAQAGHEAIAVGADVSDPDAVQAMTAQALKTFDGIDILVNVAGINSQGGFDAVDLALWERVLRINLTSVFLCCKAVLPAMRERRYGRIISISSVLAKNGGNPRPWIDKQEQARAGNVAYGASKAGIEALTFFLAKEVACDGITVNAVAPGPIASAMTTDLPATLRSLIPVGRMGRASEVADAVTFLAGEEAGFVTGEVLDVNGGLFTD
ncbi:MAG: SDR family NAD(P)-dependent oxidoreductase [Lautropia sp.]